MHTFETPSPVRLAITNGAGRVTVEAADTTESTVELTALHPDAEDAIAQAIVEQRGDDIVVRLPRERSGLFRSRQASVAIDVRVPSGSTLKTDLGSSDLRTVGALHDLTAKLGSGDAAIDVVTGSARAETGSGDVLLDRCDGSLHAASGSGDIAVGTVGGRTTTRCGSGNVTIQHAVGEVSSGSGSGDIVVRTSETGLKAKTGSGSVLVSDARSGRIDATTASGDVQVAVADGTAVWLDLNTISGDVRSDLDSIDSPGETERTLELRVKTASGDIAVGRS
ncbi:MAG: DUF4097 family beta strand repeat-containing protein [Nocardioidaceae bacterium]